MRSKLVSPSAAVWLSVGLFALAFTPARSHGADLKLQAQLVWGTDESKPPEGKNYKPVEPDIARKLKELPLKWSVWFEVNRSNFSVAPSASKKVPVSEKCELEVKNLGNGLLEVALIGKGKEVVRRKQALPKGEILVLGGNAPNSTAWLVILKLTE
jgi:hypothetical protein